MSKSIKILLGIIIVLMVLVLALGIWYFFSYKEKIVFEPEPEKEECFAIRDWIDIFKDDPKDLQDFFKKLYLKYYNDALQTDNDEAYNNNTLTFYFTCLGLMYKDLSYCQLARDIEEDLLWPYYDDDFLEEFDGYQGADHTCRLAFNQNGYMISSFLQRSRQSGRCEFNIKEWRDLEIGFSDWAFLENCGIELAVLDDLFCDTYYKKAINQDKILSAITTSPPLCQFYFKTFFMPGVSNCDDESYKLEEGLELNGCLSLQEQYISFINNDYEFCEKLGNEYSAIGLSQNSCKVFHNYNNDNYCLENYLYYNPDQIICF